MDKKVLTSEELIEGMSELQLSRWLALFDGINIINEKMEEADNEWTDTNIKHPALEDYVDDTSILILRELTGKAIV
jgi:hypothetical protein